MYEPYDDSQYEIDLVNSYPTEFVININGHFTKQDEQTIINNCFEQFAEVNNIDLSSVYWYYILKSWDTQHHKVDSNTFITEHTYTINTQTELLIN